MSISPVNDTKKRRRRRSPTPPNPSCKNCASKGEDCTRVKGRLVCERCASEGVMCETVHTHHSKRVDQRTLDLLPPGARYASSRDLLSDLRTGTSTSHPPSSQHYYSAQHPQHTHHSSLHPTASALDENARRKAKKPKRVKNGIEPAYGIISNLEIGDAVNGSSGFGGRAEARLVDVTLVNSLGDHLLSLAQPMVNKNTTYILHPLPNSWTEYYALKSKAEESLSDYMHVWMSFLLLMGSQHSPHSAILGSKSLPSVPFQSTSSPLDLRAYGPLRAHSFGTLLSSLGDTALAPNSPLRKAEIKSLSVIMLFLGNFWTDDPSLAKELLRIALGVFEKLWKEAEDKGGEEEKEWTEKLGTWWDLLIYRDNQVAVTYGSQPILTDTHYRKYSDLVRPIFLVDPFYFFSNPLRPEDSTFRDHYWANTQATTRLLATSRFRLKTLTLSSLSLSLCLHLSKLLTLRRQWRSTHFVLRTPPDRLPYYAYTSSAAAIEGKEKEETVYTTMTEVHERCLQAFVVLRLVGEEREKWRADGAGERWDVLMERVKEAADEEVSRAVYWAMELVEEEWRKGNTSVVIGYGVIKELLMTFDELPKGWKYLPGWAERFPNERARLLILIDRIKILGWCRKKWTDRIDAFEEEMFPRFVTIDPPMLQTAQAKKAKAEKEENTLADFLVTWKPSPPPAALQPQFQLPPTTSTLIYSHHHQAQAQSMAMHSSFDLPFDLPEVLQISLPFDLSNGMGGSSSGEESFGDSPSPESVPESTILDFPSFIGDLALSMKG
ncbi:hypothetical protein BT69DRAFT_1277920 [Atractiella rhizophila]|nr:hypothetical protein BT69DRAFT_1277920 [Atractiella rhizophila]